MMVCLDFAPALQRHVATPAMTVAPGRLLDVLARALQPHAVLRGYVLDDQGALRRHVAVFVNGVLQQDRQTLLRPLVDGDRVYVVQALSGG